MAPDIDEIAKLNKELKQNKVTLFNKNQEIQKLKIDIIGLKKLRNYIINEKNDKSSAANCEELKNKLREQERAINNLKSERSSMKKQLMNSSKKLSYLIECNICHIKTENELLPLNGRTNALCPKCNSSEIERGTYHYLMNKTNIFKSKNKSLLTSPSRIFADIFRKNKNIDYYGIDTKKTTYGINYPMKYSKLLFEDNTFDYIISNHLLQRLNNDKRTLKELYRVLKPKSTAIITVPLRRDLKETLEYPELINTPELREQYYKNKQFYRYYGNDFDKRLEEAGFKIENKNYLNNLSEETRNKHAILKDNLYECTKVA